MDETKFIEKIGPFGVLALFFAFFLSFTLCTCLIVHVRFIWTYLCPLKSVRDCCRSISRKFSSSHKQVPQTIHELEELVSGTDRAKKIARKVNQANSLKEFAQITPRITISWSSYAKREFSGGLECWIAKSWITHGTARAFRKSKTRSAGSVFWARL